MRCAMDPRSSRRGFFLVIEGIDGSGKTTQSMELYKRLNSEGLKALYTSEPSGNPVGLFIREEVLEKGGFPPEVEALLFAADRFQHQRDVIVPALNEGLIVVCDRFFYASLAYQGARGVDLDWIRGVNSFALKPDLAVYLDVPPEVALARKRGKRDFLEYLELEEKVRSIYMELVSGGELLLLDGRGSVEDVGNRLYNEVKANLRRLS
ncbi:MAG: dTMP kinase [Candidatus Bathyarchaeia archaeon]